MELRETRTTRSLERRVLAALRSEGPPEPGQRVLVAVSGGPDSTALLLILARLRGTLGVELTAAHFDHGLRPPEEAAADAAYVRELAAAVGVPVAFGRGDAGACAEREGRSAEEAARRLRYAFLAAAAAEHGAAAVAAGHTADDQAETVLLRVVRGTGVQGLGGMRARSPWPFPEHPYRPWLLRPLLGLRRAETERYCAAAGVVPRLDPSNLAWTYTRNRLRGQVLPALRAVNPAVDQALRRLAASAREAWDVLEAEAARRAPEVLAPLPGGEGVAVLRGPFRSLPAALQAAVLQRAAAGLLGDAQGLQWEHLDAMRRLAVERGSGRRLSLPRGLTWRVEHGRCVLAPEAGAAPPLPEVPLPGAGVVSLPGGRLEVAVLPAARFRPPAAPHEGWLDRAALGPRPLVRGRRPGDRLRPLGLGGEKKLQDVLVDARVPAPARDRLPLVVATEGWVAWVPGLALDERARVRADSREAYRLRWRPEPDAG